MSEQLLPKYDKNRWARGPWDNEPDRVDFIHAGFSCFALRNQLGNWCGYVGVPKEHPAYEKDYNDVDVNVHGGLTYADKCGGHICHDPVLGMPDDVWWLGFDCGHYNDLCPSMEFMRRHELAGIRHYPTGETYKDINYVMDEIRQLAEQLKEMRNDPITKECACDDECMACSGEICMTHDGPCECDTAERHEDADGNQYYGSWSGMNRKVQP